MLRPWPSLGAALLLAACGGMAGSIDSDDAGSSGLGGGSTAAGGGTVATGGGSTAAGGGFTAAGGGSSAVGGGTAATGGGSTAAGGGTSAPLDAGVMELIHFIGRFDTQDSAGPRFAFPGSEISASFTGTGLGVSLGDQGSNQFDVSIDGDAPTLLKTQGGVSTSIASGLAAGTHTVSLKKRTESNLGISQFKGFMPVGGALVMSPFPFSRVIEFVGDSITCGYGDLGMGPGCGFSADTEDESEAWGALTAKEFGAMHAAVAYSGRGMYRNYAGGGGDPMPVVWTRIFADDASSSWGFLGYEADVVVINLGTNDFSTGVDPGVPFENAYSGFLVSLRMAYPRSQIVCAVGPMDDDTAYKQRVQNAMTASGVSNVTLLDLGIQDQNADGLGCDYHPTTATHQKMATKLIAHIKTLLPW